MAHLSHHSDLYNHKLVSAIIQYPDWVAYKQHKFISHTSGGRKNPRSRRPWIVTGEDPLPQFIAVLPMQKRVNKLSEAPFVRAPP